MSFKYSAAGCGVESDGDQHFTSSGEWHLARRPQRLTLGTGLDQDTQVSLPLVQSLGTLPQTTGEPVIDEGVLQDLLESVLDGHGTLGGGGDLDIVHDDFFGGGSGGGVGTSVRHFVKLGWGVFFRAARPV